MARRTTENLFRPLSFARFAQEYWPTRQVVAHGPLQRLSDLALNPRLTSVEKLLKSEPPNVKLWFDGGASRGPRGAQQIKPANPEDALKLYNVGAVTVVCDDVGKHVPPIHRIMLDIQARLGLPADLTLISCNVYCSPPGRRSPMHFDCQEVIIVQLKGCKRWYLAPNTHVEYPTESYFGVQFHKRVQPGTRRPLPPSGPKATREVLMRPGSVMFLPRGMWHSPQAISESIHLTLTFLPPTWAQLVTHQLARHLHEHEAWRRPVERLHGPAAKGSANTAKLKELLTELSSHCASADLQNLDQRGHAHAKALRRPESRPHGRRHPVPTRRGRRRRTSGRTP